MDIMTRHRLAEIDRRYNPEYDVPQGNQPAVTWAEMALLEAVRDMADHIDNLERKIAELKKAYTEPACTDCGAPLTSDEAESGNEICLDCDIEAHFCGKCDTPHAGECPDYL